MAPDPYLAGLDLNGRRVIVVGAGRVAERRLPTLRAAGAEVTVIAPAAGEVIRAQADAGELVWIPRRYAVGDLAGSWYVLATTDDPATNARVSSEAETEKIFCVRSDDASTGTAWTPATVTEADLLLGLLSRNAAAHGSPGRTRDLRDRLRDRLVELLVDERSRP